MAVEGVAIEVDDLKKDEQDGGLVASFGAWLGVGETPAGGFSSKGSTTENTPIADQEAYDKDIKSLAEARKEVKSRWHKANTEFLKERGELLQSYKLLYDMEKGVTDEKDLNKHQQKELAEHRQEAKGIIMKSIRDHQQSCKEKDVYLTMQDRNFKLFQKDQGRVIATIEKDQVYDINKKRKDQRATSHNAILSALSKSQLMAKLEADGGHNARVSYTTKVKKLLRELEEVEEDTDELVERLSLKCKYINNNVSIMSAEIEDALQSEKQIVNQLDQLTNTIEKNNETLKDVTSKFRDDLEKSISSLLGQRARASIICCMLVIIIIMIGIAVLLALQLSGKLSLE